MTSPILSLTNVGLTLRGNAGDVTILRDITFAISKGESVGMIGPSGSGKSSLLMLMGGLEKATHGQVSALDQDLSQMDEDQLARFRRHHMGVVFQSFHLIPTMTALENVATPLELAGKRMRLIGPRPSFRRSGLAAVWTIIPTKCRGASNSASPWPALRLRGPISCLADEPTGNLDGENGNAIMDLLFGLQNRNGATLLLVTHSRRLAARCDRVIGLRDGRLDAPSAKSEAAE